MKKLLTLGLVLILLLSLTACGKMPYISNAPQDSQNTSINKPENDNINTYSSSQELVSNKSETSSSKDSSTHIGLDPEFKTAIDSYEKFMDNYITFMKKYQNNPGDLSLLTDYAKYMSDYADFVEDFEKLEHEDMNTAETAYYLEVQARVTKKLLEVTQ